MDHSLPLAKVSFCENNQKKYTFREIFQKKIY